MVFVRYLNTSFYPLSCQSHPSGRRLADGGASGSGDHPRFVAALVVEDGLCDLAAVVFCDDRWTTHKTVRYLLPMLPAASLLIADFCVAFYRTLRSTGLRMFAFSAIAVFIGYTSLYGAAFATIYSTEDSRIAAGRWVDENVPAGTTIGLERGGFSVRSTISSTRYHHELIETGFHFGTRGYLSCRAATRVLEERLQKVDFLVIAQENRSWQFQAASDLYPALASFYEDLTIGILGFEPVQRFKQEPFLFGLGFGERRSDPSFTGYDHPTVSIFRKASIFPEQFAAWQSKLFQGRGCVDKTFEGAVEALRKNQLDRVEHVGLQNPAAQS